MFIFRIFLVQILSSYENIQINCPLPFFKIYAVMYYISKSRISN
jgi:hypothetical protein